MFSSASNVRIYMWMHPMYTQIFIFDCQCLSKDRQCHRSYNSYELSQTSRVYVLEHSFYPRILFWSHNSGGKYITAGFQRLFHSSHHCLIIVSVSYAMLLLLILLPQLSFSLEVAFVSKCMYLIHTFHNKQTKRFIMLLYLAMQVTIDNTQARTDVNGELMDVHDGTIIR